MNEIFPIVFGMASGLLVYRWRASGWTRLAMLFGLSIVLGNIATIVSGEVLISWSFLLVDIPLVFGSALAMLLLATILRRSHRAAREQ